MNKEPLEHGKNGRDQQGRFKPGNKAATGGNPYARKVAELRAAMMKAVTKRDMAQIVGKLMEQAKAGNLKAIEITLNRVFGAPVQADILERLAELEKLLESQEEAR